MSLSSHVAALVTKHSDLDREVEELQNSPSVDPLKIRDAKRRKLALKDEIAKIASVH